MLRAPLARTVVGICERGQTWMLDKSRLPAGDVSQPADAFKRLRPPQTRARHSVWSSARKRSAADAGGHGSQGVPP